MSCRLWVKQVFQLQIQNSKVQEKTIFFTVFKIQNTAKILFQNTHGNTFAIFLQLSICDQLCEKYPSLKIYHTDIQFCDINILKTSILTFPGILAATGTVNFSS